MQIHFDHFPSDIMCLIFKNIWPALFSPTPVKNDHSLTTETSFWCQYKLLSRHWYREINQTKLMLCQFSHDITVLWSREMLSSFPLLVSLKASPMLDLSTPLLRLKRLDISMNKTMHNEQLLKWTHLEELILDQNSIIHNQSLSKLTNLTNLSLNTNRNITNEAIKNFHLLKRLSLSANNRIQSPLTQLRTLKFLDISNNYVITNRDISRFTNIRHLNLCDNLDIVDSTLVKLTRLKSLNLERNRIITDDSIRLLQNIKIINLADNDQITNTALSQLKLEHVVLSNWTDISTTHINKTTKKWTCYSICHAIHSSLILIVLSCCLVYLNI